MEEIDMIIRLKPQKEWVNAKTKEELADKFKERFRFFPASNMNYPTHRNAIQRIGDRRSIGYCGEIFGKIWIILPKKPMKSETLLRPFPVQPT
jgi:cobalt-zinc-cadmium resistance protein CzcA